MLFIPANRIETFGHKQNTISFFFLHLKIKFLTYTALAIKLKLFLFNCYLPAASISGHHDKLQAASLPPAYRDGSTSCIVRATTPQNVFQKTHLGECLPHGERGLCSTSFAPPHLHTLHDNHQENRS